MTRVVIDKARAGLPVRFPYDETVIAVVKGIPGREWNKNKRFWQIPLDFWAAGELVAQLRSLNVPFTFTDEAREWANAEADRISRALVCREGEQSLRTRGEHAHRPIRLRSFQRQAVAFAASSGRAMLGDEMGLGKTAEAVCAVAEIEHRELSDDATLDRWGGLYLVVCPNSAKGGWAEEIKGWYDGRFTEIKIVGSGNVLKDPAPGWYIVNWEKANPRLTLLEKIPWDVVIADESHRMRNKKTLQSKAVRQIGGSCRFALSGTPVKNDVTDLWAQLAWLYPEQFSSYWRFYELFADYEEGFWGREVTGVKNEEHLREVLAPIMLARSLEDVELELPAVGHQLVKVKLEGHQKAAYDRMLHEFVAWVEDEDDNVVASNWMTQVLRLKQIAGSLGIFYEDHKESAKIDALFDLLDGMPENEKFVVMSQFTGMTNLVEERLRKEQISYCVMTGSRCHAWTLKTGERKAKDRGELISFFNDSPVPRVFLATIQTGGEGITLTGARYFAFLDLLWTPADNRQAWKRVHRQGQTRPVTVYTILAEDTVDFSAVLPKLRKKQAIVDAVMEQPQGVEEEEERFAALIGGEGVEMSPTSDTDSLDGDELAEPVQSGSVLPQA